MPDMPVSIAVLLFAAFMSALAGFTIGSWRSRRSAILVIILFCLLVIWLTWGSFLAYLAHGFFWFLVGAALNSSR